MSSEQKENLTSSAKPLDAPRSMEETEREETDAKSSGSKVVTADADLDEGY